MNHKLPTKELSKTKCSQSTFRKDHAVKRHVSYGRRDDHVKDTEEMLMKKYRMGYSQLHKYLILKESNTYFANPFVWIFNLNLHQKKLAFWKLLARTRSSNTSKMLKLFIWILWKMHLKLLHPNNKFVDTISLHLQYQVLVLYRSKNFCWEISDWKGHWNGPTK